MKGFFVHKKLLCARIPYFHKMFAWGGVKTHKNSAVMPEDSPESFDVLLSWLYSGKLRYESLELQCSPHLGVGTDHLAKI